MRFQITAIQLLIILFANVLSVHATDNQKYLILSSGQEGGSYYAAGEFIKNELNKHFPKNQIVNIYSEGSYQNFERLDKRSCDLIIAQRNVLIERYYAADNPIRNVEIVMPLFSESFQIIIHDTLGSIDFDTFRSLLNKKKIKKIGIGKPGSASNVTAREVFNLMGIKISDGMLMEETSQIQLEAFQSNEIEAIVFFAAVPVKKLIDNSNTTIVTFNSDELTKLTSYFKDFNISKFNTDLYKNGTSKIVSTLGTEAFLICNYDVKNIIGNIEYEKIPYYLISASNEDKSPLSLDIKENYNQGKFKLKNNSWKIANPIDYNLFFSGIPFHSFIAKIVGKKNYDIELILFILFIGIFIIICLYVFLPTKQLKKLKFKNKYGHIFIIILFYILLTITFVYFIHFFEKINYIRYGVKGSIMNLNKFDTLKWLLIFIFTGYEDEIFPISTGAKIMTTLSFFLAPATLIITFTWQYLTNNKLKKINMGDIEINEIKHDVICGWNQKTIGLVEKLYLQNVASGNEKRKIVLLNDKLKSIDNLSDSIRILIEKDIVKYVNGNSTDIDKLKSINIQNAHSILIVCEGNKQTHDEKVLLTAYAISTYCKELKANHLSDIYLMAEINNQEYINKLKAADVNVVICSGDLINSLMIQSIHCEGIYNPIKSIIDYGEGNDFYMIKCKDYKAIINKTFDELLLLLRRQKIQLIGFKINFLDANDSIILDEDLIQTRLRKLRIENSRKMIASTVLKSLPNQVQDNIAVILVDLIEKNTFESLSKNQEAEIQKSFIRSLPDDVKELIPESFIESIKMISGFSTQYVINPQSEFECNYKTKEEDELIVLALDNKYLTTINKIIE